MISFNKFINEKNIDKIDTDKLTYQEFLKSVIDSCKKDFNMTEKQALEFTILYRDKLERDWEQNYSTREAIASTKIPGVIIKDNIMEESYIFNIDNIYESYIEKIQKENNENNILSYISNYYNKFNKPYSDKRIFNRVKNNYKNLIIISEKRLNNILYETNNGNIVVDVIDKNDDIINKIIENFSFLYKKKKDRYLKPIKITGKTTDNDINLKIKLSNKDIMDIYYKNFEKYSDELKIKINNKTIYHMDNIGDMDIIKKSSKIYDDYLKKLNFKIIKKENPFK